jgi:deoxyribonuclease IV
MFKIGLKLWSINENYAEEAVRLHQNGTYDYIELYAIPGSFKQHIHLWQDIDIPFIIHAPHFKDGLNFAKKELKDKNKVMALEAFQYADSLKAKYIIFHPGVNGDNNETVNQVKALFDSRILIENKPYFGNGENLVCNGSSPEEIQMITGRTGTGFCFDIGHSICAANAKNIEPFEYIRRFLELGPKMIHFTDGDYRGVFDRHDHYGMGSYPIGEILKLIPENIHVTYEAVKDSPDNLDDFVRDMKYLKKFF